MKMENKDELRPEYDFIKMIAGDRENISNASKQGLT